MYGRQAKTTRYLGQGDSGSGSGSQGPAGAVGPQGPQGPQGVKGDTGDTGPAGADGAQGPQGSTGAAGPQGPQGLTGPAGPIGPAGLTWKGQWISGTSYVKDDAVGYAGASYFCISDTSGTVGPDTSSDWALLAAQGAEGPPGPSGVDGGVGPAGPEGPAGPVGPAGPPGGDGAQGEVGEPGPEGPAGEAGTTVFSELEQIPDNLNPGAYLRVNDSGDGLVNVMTAPPDGGISTNNHVNSRNNTGLPIPDKVAFIWDGAYYWLDLVTITTGSNGVVFYGKDIGDNDVMRVAFKNQPGGQNVGLDGSYAHLTLTTRYAPDGNYNKDQTQADNRTREYSLEQFIDPSKRPTNDNDEMAHFYGTKSGTSGAGNLNVVKEVSNFYTELPDAIVHSHNNFEYILTLSGVGNQIFYRNEDHGEDPAHDRRLVFTDNVDGTVDNSRTIFFTAAGNLRYYIENGRALYYGSQPSTSRIGQLEDVRNTIPLASSIEIPDAILGKDGSGNLRLFKITQVRADRFDYQSNSSGSNYLFAFNSTTGEWIGSPHAANATKEFNSIQEYISNGRALYFGGTSNAGTGATKFTGLEDTPATLSADKILKTNSTGDQIILVDDVEITSIDDIADVKTSGSGHDPADGDALVWNDSHNHWMPGEITSTFAELTDTPNTLDAGSYLRVNSAGDGVEQIKTAPPDGGLGDNSAIQAKSNFAGKLPDQLIDQGVAGSVRVLDLYWVNNTGIFYVIKNQNGYVQFRNTVSNPGVGIVTETISGSPQYTSIQEYIDNGQAVFHGQKSGTSGVGSLGVIKAQAEQFYTELPDAIVATHIGGYEAILRLKFARNITDQPDRQNFYYEARIDVGNPNDYLMVFTDDTDGSFTGYASQTDSFPASMEKSLRWFIENGRAIYGGGAGGAGGAVTSTFSDLTDTPSALDAGSYLRVNSTGDGIEQIKIAPPDGGLGDNSTIQATSNFDGKLPDKIIIKHTTPAGSESSDSYGGYVVFELRQVSVNKIIYADTWGDGAYRINFNNNPAGNGWEVKGSGGAAHILSPIDGVSAPTIQQFIDNGYAIFHGQKSGTSGAGSLSTIKNRSNFESDLPDAIVVEQGGGEYILRLNRITDDYFDYMHEDYGAGDTAARWIHFTNGGVGSSRTRSGFFTGPMSLNSLQFFIENGRAIYNGGYNESNTVSARIVGSTGAVASSNYDWIESVTKVGTGHYQITFKSGHFTSIPAITIGCDHRGGVSHVIADYDSLSTTGVSLYIRTAYRNLASINIDADFSIMAQHQDRPIALAAPQYGIKAWGKFAGTEGSGNNASLSFTGGNIQSIVRVSTGLYKVTFINPAPHADYSVSGSANPANYRGASFGVREDNNPVTTTDFHIEVRDQSNDYSNSSRISFQVVY